MSAATTTGGYADVFQVYTDLGWPGVIKLKAGTKWPPPAGFTGGDGVDPSYADMQAWADEEPDGNTALRLPDGYIGIDEDRYGRKTGQQTIAEAERRWGALPDAKRSTSRGDGSGIRIYRVPAGIKFVEKLKFPELGLGGVEIIQRHHRYVMAWPSVHDTTGNTYEWYEPDGTIGNPPHIEDIPDLPEKWVEALRVADKPSSSTGLGSDGPYNVRQALTEGEPSTRVAAKLGEAIVACAGGSRHDTTRDNVLGLLRCGKQGEPGVKAALTALHKTFVEAVWKDRAGGREEATTEFRNFLFSDKAAELLADTGYDFTDNVTEVDAADLSGGDGVAFSTSAKSGALDSGDPLEGAIVHRMQALRVNREAQRRLDAEDRPPLELPPVRTLDELLAEPDEENSWMVDQVMEVGSKNMLVAQYKAGKTNVMFNLTRSLADVTPFLGAFEVKQPPSRIGIIDDELSEAMLRRWLRCQGISNTAAVADVISLRGRVGVFNLLDDTTRAEWATRLRDQGIDFLVLDCLRPVLDALGLDENRDAGRFLTAFDALMLEAGIVTALVVDHMGHQAERNRGDSRKLDWPDATWKLVREDDQPDSDRFFSCYGRDVDVPEGRLAYNPENHHLTYINLSRSDIRGEEAAREVIRELMKAAAAGAKPNRGALERSLANSVPKQAVRNAVTVLEKRGLILVEQGPTNSKLHSIKYPCAECRMPVVTGRDRHESCPGKLDELALE